MPYNQKTKALASKPLDELRGAMLDEAVIAFENVRAKMNSAVRPYKDLFACSQWIFDMTDLHKSTYSQACFGKGRS